MRTAAVGELVFDGVQHLLGIEAAEGVSSGCRDGSTGAIITEGRVAADPNRRMLDLQATLQMLHDAGGTPANHGITQKMVEERIGYYSVRPVPTKPIRMVVLNTLHASPASSQGWIDEAQLEWAVAELERAEAANELVVIGSHHRSGSLHHTSPVSAERLTSVLAEYDNVVLHITGHGHDNRAELIRPEGRRGYWELMLASTVDFPMQTRIFEIVQDGNGQLSIYVTNLDQNAPDGSMAGEARHLAAAHEEFKLGGNGRRHYVDGVANRNQRLVIDIDSALEASLSAADFPTRIESLEHLARLGSDGDAPPQ